MQSLKSLCFEALAHGRAWDVLEAGAMTNNGAQRIEVCLDVTAENYRVGYHRQNKDFKYNHHIHWTLDVVSAEVTTLHTGDLCLIRSDTDHRVALAWFDSYQERRCVLMLKSPETVDRHIALRYLGEVWVVQGMPPITINPNGCIVKPAYCTGSALTSDKKRETAPRNLISKEEEIIRKSSKFSCFSMLVHLFHHKRNAVAPIMGN
jgi:hypothetical protein